MCTAKKETSQNSALRAQLLVLSNISLKIRNNFTRYEDEIVISTIFY